MIEFKEPYFLLSTKNTSMILSFKRGKKLTCEYYSSRIVSIDEAPSLEKDFPFNQGTSIALDKENPSISEDYLKLELSTYGRGDYHDPSLILVGKEGTSIDLRYDSFEIREPNYDLPTPVPHDAKEELVIVLKDEKMGVVVKSHYLVYEEKDVFGRYLEIVNENDGEVIIKKASSCLLSLPNKDYVLTNLYGGWAGELNREDIKLKHGIYSRGSNAGLSSCRYNPFMMIHEDRHSINEGDAYGFNLLYSGNHLEEAELDTFSMLRLQIGINPLLFEKSLQKEDKFVTPVAILSYSSHGETGLSHNMQGFVDDHVVPPEWSHKVRPVVYNNWEATMFKFNKSKIIGLMKKAATLGVELFVLDDGWFGSRNDDSHGLGDWDVNKKKLPGGLKALADKADKLGLKFGIWMEPEMVNENSNLFASHPDWILHDGIHTPVEGRNQFVLDLAKEEVQDFIYDSVSSVLKSANISFLKWDCNRSLTDFAYMPGNHSYDWVVGLYKVLSRLVKEFPCVLFENCASGGNRFDLGMLSYFPQSWMSDDTDSYQRQIIQGNAALGYPLSVMSNHVAAKTSNQMLRLTSFDSKFDTACFGVLGYEMDIGELNGMETKILKSQIEYYKAHRELLQFGKLTVFKRIEEGNEGRFLASLNDEHMFGLFRKIQLPNPPEGRMVVDYPLDKNALYEYEERQESISVKKFGHLVNMISPIKLKEDGYLLNLLSHHMDMKSEVDKGMASGSALMNQGAFISQEWSGVGYSDRIRLMGDFGGRLYYIKKKE